MNSQRNPRIHEIETLAQELAVLNPQDNADRARTIESRIAEMELSLLGNIKGKAYFPLLKRFNRLVSYESFYDIFVDVLMGLLRNYNPDKGSFSTALAFQLNHRIKDYFRQSRKDTKIIPLETHLKKTVVYRAPWDEPDFIRDADKPSSEIDIFVRLAPFIAEQQQKDKLIVKKMWFERFFTFDVTKTVIRDQACAQEALSVNSQLFPVMDTLLLEHLMYGTFSHMGDITETKLKNPSSLKKRNETIQKCYNISKPIVCERNAKYFAVLKQVCGANACTST